MSAPVLPEETTPPADATLRLQFDPAIANPECLDVRVGDGSDSNPNQPYIAYWSSGSPDSANCPGTPDFIGVADADHCFSVSSAVGQFGVLDLTFLACNAANNQVCAWTAVYQIGDPSLPPNYGCTTGNNYFDGSPLQQPSPFGANSFATAGNNQQSNAPFTPGTCYTPTRLGTGAPHRSYQVFCSKSDMPAEWQQLDVVNGFLGPLL